MSNAFFKVPVAINEPVQSYAPGSSERASLLAKYQEFKDRSPIEVPMYIGGSKVTTTNKKALIMPHDHQKVIGHYNQGDATHVTAAIDAALRAKTAWAALPKPSVTAKRMASRKIVALRFEIGRPTGKLVCLYNSVPLARTTRSTM